MRFKSILVFTFALIASSALAQDKLGLTWSKISHDSTYNVDLVGTTTGNPYEGDTACTTALPILCIQKSGAPNPGVPTDIYTEWAGGSIMLSTPVAGNTLKSQADGDAACSSTTPGYQMAEFHDGWGWNFQASGNVSDASRFWVAINDQPANCWDPIPTPTPVCTPTPEPTPTCTPSPTPNPTPEPSPTATPTTTPEPSPTPIILPTPTVSPTPDISPTPTASPTPSATPTPGVR